VDIIEGLKRNPVVAVPLVLRRLRAKDEEWREVQKNFNKVWRDQNEKHYLKSLDHQCMQFKQSDTRNLRSKSLLNEIETLYDERHEQEEAINNAVNGERQNIVPEGPHMTIEYQDPSILDDVNNLLIHHVKRQTSIHKEDKQKIKLLLRHFLMDTFKHPRQDLSEDEREDEEDSSNKEDNESDTGNNLTGNLAHVGSNNGNSSNINANSSVNTNALANSRDSGATTKATRSERARKKKEEKREKDKQSEEKSKKEKDEKCIKEDITETDIKLDYRDGRKTPLHARDMEPDESYMHMICNNNWYLFYRLHHILCERLTKMYNQAVIIANEESKDKKDRKECTAVALRLIPSNTIEPEDYYPAFIDMVKNLLDGNMDAQSYEDTLREMFGIHAYISFTLDKVVGNAVRQLQHLVTDEAAIECYDMFLAESKNKATGGFCSQAHERQIAEMIYQKKLEKLLADENCMKIFVYHQSCKLTIEMLDTETDGQNSDDEKDETARKYASYVDRFIQPDESVSIECKEHLTAKPVFLPRSVRSYNLSPYGKARSAEAQEINNSDELENHADVKHNSCTTVKDPLEKEK
jgi:paired amphipathic helix protein Sin3a